jgi:hypothetical protein
MRSVWSVQTRCDAGLTGLKSGRAEYQESLIPQEGGHPRIEAWLNARRDFKRAGHLGQHNDPVVGGLRLLVQKWTEEDGILVPDQPVMPFSWKNFGQIMEKLHLPRSFPLDFAGSQQIPTEVKKISTRDGVRFGGLLEHHLCLSLLTQICRNHVPEPLVEKLYDPRPVLRSGQSDHNWLLWLHTTRR